MATASVDGSMRSGILMLYSGSLGASGVGGWEKGHTIVF